MHERQVDRRGLIGAGMILAGSGALAGSARGQEPASPVGGWQPAMEDLDSWLDKPGTRHRMVLDTTSANAAHEGVGYLIHFLTTNQTAYGVGSEQLGLVLVLRHGSTPFGYNDSIWARYGNQFAKEMKLKGDMAKQASTTNPMLSKPAGDWTPAKGMEWTAEAPLAGLAEKGVRFAVCGLATKGIAGRLAGKKGDAEAIEAELRSNLVPGALIVPAGIVAVNRAQEHGYTFAYTG